MACLSARGIERIYPVSTSKNPPSSTENSFGTPMGLHALADHIGADAASGTVFKGRKSTGSHFKDLPEVDTKRNLITSRIIRLRGLEPGRNLGKGVDSYDRYIYIHGSNHEERIGEPFSGGCIEMFNSDVIEFFEQSQEGELLWIV